MLDFAVKLTREQHHIGEADVEDLKRHGFDDRAVSHIVQVTALFNYFTRLASGLGADSEPEWG